MDYDYKTHSMLATSGSWFKNILELVWYFNVQMNVSAAFQLRAIHREDISLMSEFMCTGNFSQPDLISLNIMRIYKKVIHKLDIVLRDGKTITAEMLADQPGHSDIHKFPTQHPTPADLNLWKLAVRKISSNFHVFTVKLQDNISPPHNHPQWIWLEIPNFGTDFWDPHRKRNSNSVFDSRDYGCCFFFNSNV
jgi:hypothetical protein